jgi:hypothetical protein
MMNPRFSRLTWFPLLAVALVALTAVWSFGVNVPFYDEWTHAEFLLKWHDGHLTVSDLWAQYNESRKVIPRLAMILLAEATGHDLRFQMTAGILLGAAATIIFTILLRDHYGVRTPAIPVVVAVLLFHPMQVENWLWGVQFICQIPLLCLAIGTWLLSRRPHLRTRLVLPCLIVLCVAASISYASGLLLWPVMCIGLAYEGRWRAVSIMTVTSFIFAIVYLTGYHRPEWMPGWSEALSDPVRVLDFVVVQVGLGWGLGAAWWADGQPLLLSRVAGIVTLIVLCVGLWNSRRRKMPMPLPALLLLLYALGCIALTALGRSPLGPMAALPARYVTFTIPVTLVAVLLMAGTDHRNRWLAMAVCAVTALMIPGAAARAERLNTRQLEGKAALMLALCRVSPGLDYKLADHYPLLLQTAKRLSDAGYLQPKLIDPKQWIGAVAPNEAAGTIRVATIPSDLGSPEGSRVEASVAYRPGWGPPAIIVGSDEEKILTILEDQTEAHLYLGRRVWGVTRWYAVWADRDRLYPLRLIAPDTRP